tara:strand:- start:587 stop:829 length:243 start_codon:yes stop_codon:yes gene_type:complete
MISKWKIKDLEGFVFGEDKKLYKLPYSNKGREYGLTVIKKQLGSRYKINGEWLSEKQMKHRLYLDTEPIELIIEDKSLPF